MYTKKGFHEVNTCAIQEIWKYLLINMLPLILLGLVVLSVAIYALITKSFKTIYAIGLIVLAIFIIAYSATELLLFKIDIDNQSFAEYQGTFEYARVLGNRRDQIHLTDEPKTWIRSVAFFDLDSGERSGSILYGKHSRWVIDIQTLP